MAWAASKEGVFAAAMVDFGRLFLTLVLLTARANSKPKLVLLM